MFRRLQAHRLPLILLFISSVALAEAQPKAIPALTKALNLSGPMKDLSSGVTVKPVDADNATAGFVGHVAYKKDTVYVGIEMTDDKLLSGDIVTLSIFFPEGGTTARGYSWRFAHDGMRSSDAESGTPTFAQSKVEAKVVANDKGMNIKAAIPAIALPRWPVKEPLVMDLCITVEDRDEMAAPPTVISNCKNGSAAEPLKLPDDFRKQLKLKPPDGIEGVEGSPVGWVGYQTMHQPKWIYADENVTAQTIQTLFADALVDPDKARVSVPRDLEVAGEPLLGVVVGKDPYAVEGQCNGDNELRLLLYRADKRTAERVLDWPASTCPLGRATSVSVDPENNLTIGYTNGAIVTFAWEKDHFERTEIGQK